MVVVFFFNSRQHVKVNSRVLKNEFENTHVPMCVRVCVFVSRYNILATKMPSFWNCITLVDRCVDCDGGGNIALRYKPNRYEKNEIIETFLVYIISVYVYTSIIL